jgi:ABC-type sugar transport system substrate-binding protein
MRKTRFIAFAGALALAVASFGPVAAQEESPAAEGSPAVETRDPGAAAGAKLFVNMKGPGGGNPFWAAVERGAIEAGEAWGVDVTVIAPPTESDIPAQIAQMEDVVAQGASGVAIAPTDPAALFESVQAAIDAGVHVVFVDSNGTNEGVTFIGTNNEVGAALAGQYLCDNLEAGSKVAILQGIITTTTGQARADGARASVTECGLDLVAEVPAEWDTARGQAATEDILTQHPDLAGLFASNDNMALGAVEALRGQDLLDQVTVVGFDANPNAAAAILAGDMEATIAQSPYNMGWLSVEALVQLINGETLEPIIDTGTELVTAENAEDYTE